ncbi:N-methylhydantoinase B [Streptomyces sp. T12]|uniref:hydantoinase B/oxoprolinase family protein n=1 Tax=Streptomyces sp. T12 TaxID=477697 RepID=UPI0011A60B51|nr:hydantoinase B/oxoprolinase family protein [Streptomyces sp. T12]TWD11711.1 N-methylhydantoinase B [Streptomyces sp. T12]
MTDSVGTVWDGRVRGYIPNPHLTVAPGLKLHERASKDIDPITFAVVRYALLNVNVEHGQTLQRLCVSPITMLTRDFQPSITLHDGDLVYLGPYIQYFSTCQSLTIKWILENRSENPGIEPGDMFLSNDPYVGSPHQPDVVVAAPVFIGDELFCWVANILNHADVGGTSMGSFCMDAPDMFSDPPAIPPVKIVSRGRVEADVEQLFLRQSRLPDHVHLDLRAAISANSVATDRILALVERYGADVVKGVMTAVLDASERTFVDRLRHIPDGEWSHRILTEGNGPGDDGIYAYHLTVRKRGEHLWVDNAGTDPQTGAINVAYAGLLGAFLCALTAAMAADLAGAYGGVHRRVTLEPVPGTLSCADFPAAISPAGAYTMETLISLSGSVVAKMLSCASPELQRMAIGPANPAFYAVITGGEQAGRPFIAPDVTNMIGGLSATPYADGVDFGGHFWIPEGIAGNVEELEQLWPMLFLYRRALPVGADGAGEYRGGRGFVQATVPWSEPGLGIALYMDESFPSLAGPFGGNPGTMARFRLRRGSDILLRLANGEVPQSVDALDGEWEPVRAKGPLLLVGATDLWEWTGANGAGWGDPLKRDPDAVLRDVRTGALDRRVAQRVHAVVIGPEDRAVDTAATATARDHALAERLREAKPPHITPSVLDPTTRIRTIAGELGLANHHGTLSFVSLTGRAVLGPADGDFTQYCAVLEQPVASHGPEFTPAAGRPGREVRYRAYLCPVTGLRIDGTVVRAGEELPPGLRLT